MILEAMAALTLHCVADVRNRPPETPKVSFALTVDYASSYAYMTVGDQWFFETGGVEFPGIRVTPGEITLPPKEIGLLLLEQANINRTNGALYLRIQRATTGTYMVLDGVCRPGDYYAPPRPAF